MDGGALRETGISTARRDGDAEFGAPARLTADVDAAAAATYNSFANRQAQPEPVAAVLRRKEGVEQFAHLFGGHTNPGVAETQLHAAIDGSADH